MRFAFLILTDFTFGALSNLLLFLSFLTLGVFGFALFTFRSTLFIWCSCGILGCLVVSCSLVLLLQSLFLSSDFLLVELIDVNVRFLVLRSGRVFVWHVHRARHFRCSGVLFVGQDDGLFMTELTHLFLHVDILQLAAPINESAAARLSHEAGGEQRQRNLTQAGRHINLSNLNY